MTHRNKAWASLIGYVIVIIAANWMTNVFGLVSIVGLAVTAGTFAAGLALIMRDAVQVYFGKAVSLVAILVGAGISAFTSTPAIALASGIAFLVSELVDFGVFTPLRSKSLPLAVVSSSIVSAPVDTVLFLHIAGFGITWEAVVGQFIVKTIIALIVAAGLFYREKRSVGK
jgi:Uncharacterized conserved protein